MFYFFLVFQGEDGKVNASQDDSYIIWLNLSQVEYDLSIYFQLQLKLKFAKLANHSKWTGTKMLI